MRFSCALVGMLIAGALVLPLSAVIAVEKSVFGEDRKEGEGDDPSDQRFVAGDPKDRG